MTQARKVDQHRTSIDFQYQNYSVIANLHSPCCKYLDIRIHITTELKLTETKATAENIWCYQLATLSPANGNLTE